MYINADNTLSPSLPQALFTKQAAVQPHRVSLKPPFKSIHASALEAQWPLVYKLSACEPKGFSPHCFHTLNKLFEGVHQLAWIACALNLKTENNRDLFSSALFFLFFLFRSSFSDNGERRLLDIRGVLGPTQEKKGSIQLKEQNAFHKGKETIDFFLHSKVRGWSEHHFISYSKGEKHTFKCTQSVRVNMLTMHKEQTSNQPTRSLQISLAYKKKNRMHKASPFYAWEISIYLFIFLSASCDTR